MKNKLQPVEHYNIEEKSVFSDKKRVLEWFWPWLWLRPSEDALKNNFILANDLHCPKWRYTHMRRRKIWIRINSSTVKADFEILKILK